ncbi:lipoyl(octanoyl) transferase LipB [cf. Phormidesmis sp. LEGE 11477]|nr:lipoyl(octanoyl) transferase LipB [cf. Phormidesmis sp. LEGE 11477]
MPYAIAWKWQQQLANRYKGTSDESTDAGSMRDTLILLQHPPVYTLGQGADIKFLKFAPESKHYEIHRVERGGEVTYHAPGQVVGYPILNLRQHRMDLHWYLRQLEEVIILVLAEYGLKGDRIPGMTGVWVNGYKLAAIGIKVSRWITMHGFALNVCPDMSGFERIVPCGLEGKSVGAMAQFIPDIRLSEVQQTLIKRFERVFGLAFQPVSVSDLNL